MTKFVSVILGVCSLAMLIQSFSSLQMKEEEEEEQMWAQNLCGGKEKLTKLHFYLQDFVGGPNRTVFPVAKSEVTDSLPSKFGAVLVLDNPVTAGPEPGSKELGRLKGIVGLSDLHEISLSMLVNLVLTEGKYNGSTLSILGRNPLFETAREVPVVGGTGVFRMARGYVITKTYFYDVTNIHNIFEYTVFVFHFD